MPKRATVTGQQLVNDFQSAVIAIITSQSTRMEAERSENQLVQHLRDVSAGTFLQPDAFASDNQSAIARASVDAHIKKVQAEQIGQLNARQLADMQTRATADFVNRKVRIKLTNLDAKPLEAVWFDPRTGYRNSLNTRRVVTGTITSVLLDRNALVIRPPRVSRLLNSRLQSYVVYVIDPETLQPAVELTVI